MSHDSTARAKALLVFSVATLLAAALLFGRSERGRALWQDLSAWVEGQGGVDDGTYWCPMDPQIVRPREGICPICSMDLVLFEGGGVASVPGVLQLSDRQVQQAGVRLGLAEVRGLVRDIDTTGRLEVDPSKRSVVTVDYPGASRIEVLYVHATGERIREGQVVATVKNPQAEALLTEYRRLLKEYAALRRVPEEAWRAAEVLQEVDRIRKQFEDYGLPDPHINVLAAKPKHMFTDPVFPVIAFESGVALEGPTRISGQQIQQGGSLLSVADLGSLWLTLELYEHEMPFITPGSRVHFATSAAPGEAFQAQIQFIEPMMKERSQTFRARCRVSNRKGRLAPGMSVRARLASEVYEVLCVPESAVLQSGRRNVVIVSEGGGRFRPKLVELGRRHLSIAPATEDEDAFGSAEERFHEVLSGVAAGDRVVVAGNFLLNAEAQFQGVLKKMYQAVEAQERAPVLTEEQLASAQTLLDDYLALAGALTMDDSTDLARLGQALVTHASDEELRALSPAFEGMANAGQEIIAVARAAEPDLEQARRHFGSLSREVVAFLAEFAPARLAGGELFLFRCPMAEDYGFDLWVQADARLANPYMGQRMLECGMPAELP